MGSWGTALYDDDTASEVRDAYADHLKHGFSDAVAARAILERLGDLLKDREIAGERLIFRCMRPAGFISTNGGQVLRKPHVCILWASWHLATALGRSLPARCAHRPLPRR